MPDPQSESSVAVLGVSTSACPAPIDAAGRVAQSFNEGRPICQPLRLTAEVPVLNSSTHSRLVSEFCGSYMISLMITSPYNENGANVAQIATNIASLVDWRFVRFI